MTRQRHTDTIDIEMGNACLHSSAPGKTFPWCHLTKTRDITIQIYRKSHTEIDVSEMHISRCMDSKCAIYETFEVWLIMISYNYDILILSETNPKA